MKGNGQAFQELEHGTRRAIAVVALLFQAVE